MSDWLDTQTKALSHFVPPQKLAPADTGMFALVLLTIEIRNCDRVALALRRILRGPDDEVHRVLGSPLPIAVTHGLSHEDALLGQCELICCDCISVFVRKEVATRADPWYLAGLYSQLRKSQEFEVVSARIESVPDNPQGEAFLATFLGHVRRWFPIDLKIMRKKARIMQHWAAKIGVRFSATAAHQPDE